MLFYFNQGNRRSDCEKAKTELIDLSTRLQRLQPIIRSFGIDNGYYNGWIKEHIESFFKIPQNMKLKFYPQNIELTLFGLIDRTDEDYRIFDELCSYLDKIRFQGGRNENIPLPARLLSSRGKQLERRRFEWKNAREMQERQQEKCKRMGCEKQKRERLVGTGDDWWGTETYDVYVKHYC